ncbi:hypothetical protein QOZ80_7BG0610930 [Eleusine coracana subsp. coracana]|nr:hypothetical protein QOZ80_7BG0610930 [Eleusine coracana subsp. coracana]
MAQSIIISAVDEHRVPMPAHIAGQGKKKGATPEKQLNRFVRIVTFIERVGNALGTLAFTWATVVLLGGYPTVLCRGWFRDFWCATAVVFLEATRMFSRNNKLDYQLFFHTKGAFRRFGLQGLIAIVYLSNILNYLILKWLQGNKVYRFVAASLLQNLCRHAQTELKEHDMKEISYSLREVLERIMVTESTELEILIGLSSHISQVIPEAFTRGLEQGQIKGTFVKRLIDALNANMEPCADCPGIRRVILQQAISLMEFDSRYANFFKDRGMKEALSIVEETSSDVENYNLFLGDAGLIEAREPLPRLVARAKELLAVR